MKADDMGMALMTQALDPYWAQQVHVYDRLVLLRMCLSAKDHGTDAGQYFGGHQVLAITVSGNYELNAQRQVRRAIANLIKTGAITRIRHPNTGGKWSTTAYQITLDNHGPHPVDNHG
jgi:hypothetical protein